eukprot:4565549-Amphidinium_carterae.2
MGTTFMDGPSFERAYVGTYCHWSSGRAKSLDYIAASTEGFSFASVKDMHADITTTDHYRASGGHAHRAFDTNGYSVYPSHASFSVFVGA